LQERLPNLSTSALADALLALALAAERSGGSAAEVAGDVPASASDPAPVLVPSSDSLLRPLAEGFAERGDVKEVGRESLLGLASAAARSSAVRPAFEPIVRTVAATASSWNASELTKLLLAVAKGKEHANPDVVESLFSAAEGVLTPAVLADLSAGDVAKVVLAASSLWRSTTSGASVATRTLGLLGVAAGEVAMRLSDFSVPQMLLITQGLALGLAADHGALPKVLEYWQEKLRAGKKVADSAKLALDQVAKLAISLMPFLREASAMEGAVKRRFVQVLGDRLHSEAKEIPEAHRPQLKAELRPEGGLGLYTQREELLIALSKKPAKAQQARSRSRSRDGKATQGFSTGTAAKRKKRKLSKLRNGKR